MKYNDYNLLSLEELYDIERNINKELHPDRYESLIRAIRIKEVVGEKPQKSSSKKIKVYINWICGGLVLMVVGGFVMGMWAMSYFGSNPQVPFNITIEILKPIGVLILAKQVYKRKIFALKLSYYLMILQVFYLKSQNFSVDINLGFRASLSLNLERFQIGIDFLALCLVILIFKALEIINSEEMSQPVAGGDRPR